MFCENCGVEIEASNQFCENCGAVNQRAQGGNTLPKGVNSSLHEIFMKATGNKKIVTGVLTGMSLLICVTFFVGAGSRKYISLVKNGSNDYYDQLTTGEALNVFLKDMKWHYNSDTKLVEVTGDCLNNGIPVTAKIEYCVYDNGTFVLNSVSLNDGYSVEYLSERESVSFLSDIYDSAYRDKGLEPPDNLGDTMNQLDFLMDFLEY
ncbi:zinc-ribbon domain-containing protein [Enterocloster citroniae]